MANKMTSMAFVVFLLAMILSTNTVQADECLNVMTNIISGCRNYLQNPTSISTQCCDALRNIDNNMCKCFKNHPLASAFLPSKAQQLPGTCNLPGISSIVECLAPKEISIPFPGPPISFNFPPLTDLLPPTPATTTGADEPAKNIIITLPPISLPFPQISLPFPFPFPPLTGFLPPISFPFPPPTPAVPAASPTPAASPAP